MYSSCLRSSVRFDGTYVGLPVVTRRFFPPSWGSGCPEPQPFLDPNLAATLSMRVPFPSGHGREPQSDSDLSSLVVTCVHSLVIPATPHD